MHGINTLTRCLIFLLIDLQSVPSEVERNLWSSISSVKPLISKTIEAYGLTNITEEEVRYSGHDYCKITLLYLYPVSL